ncbi:hypothetical protein [Azospirillum soli]|uniref:hypothetical protein n=1 Tax=Azospirillum soli TaxID=1304799 RepID=UPI001AEA02A1|nr:hypothetical protein [Azospirillum soli]MBP2311948.1 hypothetical protein [Azospirillum soli]
MSKDPREARIRELEQAIADIAAEAHAASYALCAHELQMRLENIARRAEAVHKEEPPTQPSAT